MNIAVYDDIIPKHLQDYYELGILGRTSEEDVVQYATVPFKARYELSAEEDGITPLSFVHVLKSDTALSPYLENFGLIPLLACQEENLTLEQIIVARIYVLTPHPTKLKHYKPHVDFPFSHTVVLYYVNDADGATVFYDKQGNIVKEVEPKRGRTVIFDGNIFHSGGIPRKGPRSVVNFDILTRKI